MDYSQAIKLFKEHVINIDAVAKLSEYHNRSKDDVVKHIMPYIVVKGASKGHIISVGIDFTDTISGISIKFKIHSASAISI